MIEAKEFISLLPEGRIFKLEHVGQLERRELHGGVMHNQVLTRVSNLIMQNCTSSVHKKSAQFNLDAGIYKHI
jgi:hypothetical protein